MKQKKRSIEHELHPRKAEGAIPAMKKDAEKSKSGVTFYAISFDLEKFLLFPKVSYQVSYCKRNCYH